MESRNARRREGSGECAEFEGHAQRGYWMYRPEALEGGQGQKNTFSKNRVEVKGISDRWSQKERTPESAHLAAGPRKGLPEEHLEKMSKKLWVREFPDWSVLE